MTILYFPDVDYEMTIVHHLVSEVNYAKSSCNRVANGSKQLFSANCILLLPAALLHWFKLLEPGFYCTKVHINTFDGIC